MVMDPQAYTDPAAQTEVLNLGDSPENREIAARILELQRNSQTGAGATTQMAMSEVPPTLDSPAPGSGPALPGPTTPIPPPPASQYMGGVTEYSQRLEAIEGFLFSRGEDPVPWNPEITWQDWANQVRDRAEEKQEGSGLDVLYEAIDKVLQGEDSQLEVSIPDEPMVVAGASSEEIPGIEQLRREQDLQAAEPEIPEMPTLPTTPIEEEDTSGIMGAANGGLIKFALGGLNEGANMGAGPGVVDPAEFLKTLNAEASQAGLSDEDMTAIANVATETTGGSGSDVDNILDTGIMQTVEAEEATDQDLSGIGSLNEISDRLVNMGGEPLVHATPGELIFDPKRLGEADQRMLLAALETAGIDPDSATVGNANNILNEMTGLPAFGFFSSIGKAFKSIGKGIGKAIKKTGKFLKKNAGTILGIAGAMTGNPWLAALGSGIGSLIEGKGLQASLISAGMSFAGTKWVGPWIGEQLQGVEAFGIGDMFKTTAGDALGKVPGLNPGDALGRGMATQTAVGGALNKAQQTALTAGAEAAIGGASKEAVNQVITNSLSAAASNPLSVAGSPLGKLGEKAVTDAMSRQAIAATAKKLTSNVMAQATPGFFTPAITQASQATMDLGGQGLGNLLQKSLATPVGEIAGRSIAAYGQKMYEDHQQGLIDNEQAVLDEWNRRYDYAPSQQELLQFYTDVYIPNQQVNPGLIGGIPGYATPGAAPSIINQPSYFGLPGGLIDGGLANSYLPIAAAGGGYIDGVGGPKTDSNLARLSNGEFVMTEAAVRGAGYGDRMAGARRMYDLMNGLEQRAV